jgi:hypothetical protein
MSKNSDIDCDELFSLLFAAGGVTLHVILTRNFAIALNVKAGRASISEGFSRLILR